MNIPEPNDSAGDASGVRLFASATLADVLAVLEAAPAAGRRRVEMKSALRRMGEVLRRSLVDIPADPAALRTMIAGVSRASAGLTKERWSCLRSLTLASLRDVGIDTMPGRDIASASPAWKALKDQLPTKALRIGLSRLVSHFTRESIEPHDVTVEAFGGFLAALKTRSLKDKPEALYRKTARLWNKAIDSLAAWPQVRVPLERHRRFYSLAWEAFQPSFVDDAEGFLTESGGADARDVLDDGYVRPVRPATIALRKRQIRQLGSVLVASGFAVKRLTSLADLIEPANARAALRYQRQRQGGQTTTSLGQQAWLLCTIARYWVKDLAAAAQLREIARLLNVKPKGMTPRNRERLRQFDLRANQEALLLLPAAVLARAKRENLGNADEARRVMLATAIELLIVSALRAKNLTGLEQGRHLVEIGRGRRRNVHIIIPSSEMKTDTSFEMILPPESVAMLEAYLKTYRARLCSVPSTYVFPAPDGGRRSTIPFSKAISTFIERETGLRMHVHLFRHLAGKLHLNAHPSDLETVRRVLSHASTATTARHYAELRIGQAIEKYDGTIANLRAAAARHKPRRPSNPSSESRP